MGCSDGAERSGETTSRSPVAKTFESEGNQQREMEKLNKAVESFLNTILKMAS
jgi:hypothetical protein